MPILSGRGTASSLIRGDATVAPYYVIQPYLTAVGSVTEGSVITINNGSWKGAAPLTFSKQWQRNGIPISGATSDTYTVITVDIGAIITCVVTAINNYGNTLTQSSNSYTPSPSIPIGSIIMYNGTDPGASGWSRYSAADDSYIQGTATQGDIGTTVAASGTLSANYTVATAGAHFPGGIIKIEASVNSGSTISINYTTAGDHTHTGSISTIDVTTARPYTTAMTLLVATTTQASFPANTIHMRDIAASGWTQKVATTSNRFIRGGASGVVDVDRVAPTGSGTTSIAGAHTHINSSSMTASASAQSGNTKSSLTTTGQQHSHTINATAYITNLLSKALKLWIAASEEVALTGDMLIFSGTLTSLPPYWKICDGTNGTVDMRSYFLGYSDVSSTAHGTTINRAITVSANTSTNTWTHEHGTGSVGTNLYTVNVVHSSASASHFHNVFASAVTEDYVPPTIKLAFIQFVPA